MRSRLPDRSLEAFSPGSLSRELEETCAELVKQQRTVGLAKSQPRRTLTSSGRIRFVDAPHLLERVRTGRLSGDSTNITSNSKATDCGPIISMGESQGHSRLERVLLSAGRYVYFGPFCVDQQRQEVSRGGSRLKLQAKIYLALLTLLEKPGEVVTREELRMRLWPPDTHVNYDANVNTTVNKLRRVLGDSSDKPVYVETIPRRGYCLLVRPEVSNVPRNSQPFIREGLAEGTEAASQIIAASRLSKFRLWIVLGIIGLVLAGMFLGAGIMGLRSAHATSVPCVVAGLSGIAAEVLLVTAIRSRARKDPNLANDHVT